MDSRLSVSRTPSKPGGAVEGLLKATITVAGAAVASNSSTGAGASRLFKVAGALFSVATFASLGAAYLLLKSKSVVNALPNSPRGDTSELERTWKAIFEQLGQQAFSTVVPIGVVPRFSCNSFRANVPNEDALMHFVYSDGGGSVRSLFGVFDGHSTKAASQFASEELPGFVERRLRVLDMQEKKLKSSEAPAGSALKFANERARLVKEALIAAFLDTDRFFLCESIIMHLINGGQPGVTRSSLERCFSGTCAIVVLIDHGILYCANAGDCRAVLGVERPAQEDGDPPTITAAVLSNDHNTDNDREVSRIRQTHPSEPSLFSNGRIKGILKPTRHIGGALLKEPIARRFVRSDVLNDSWNPPYTTASPEVSIRHLTPADRFIILGTDGLWDLVSSEEAVQLVCEYEMLQNEGLIPSELNVCTFIIERALARAVLPKTTTAPNGTSSHVSHQKDSTSAFTPSGSSNHGANTSSQQGHTDTTTLSELERLSTILTLPAGQRRDVYDDITVTVIYLDTGRREQAGTAMAALSNWADPQFPESVDRVAKLKKALPLAKPLARLLTSGTAESQLIKTYLEECWPERHLDRWTPAGLTTRKFLKSLGIQLAPSNLPLGKMTAASPTGSRLAASSSQVDTTTAPTLLDVRIEGFD